MKPWPNSKPMQRGPIRRPPTLLGMPISANLVPTLAAVKVPAVANLAELMALPWTLVVILEAETSGETLEDLAEVDYEWIQKETRMVYPNARTLVRSKRPAARKDC